MDTFGDGWNDAKLHIIGSLGQHQTFQPEESSGYNSVVDYCVNPLSWLAGTSVMFRLIGLSKRPQYSWEVSWTRYYYYISILLLLLIVTITQIYWTALDALSGQSYSGSYNSFMTFTLLKSSSGSYSFVLVKFDNLMPPENEWCG